MLKFLLTAILFCSSILAQGEIFSKEKANELFGDVIESVEIDTLELEKLLEQTNNFVMFKIDDGKLNILGDDRKVLLENFPIVEEDIYRLFSKTKTIELISMGDAVSTYVELRGDEVITVTNGNYTMEVGSLCPPFCN